MQNMKKAKNTSGGLMLLLLALLWSAPTLVFGSNAMFMVSHPEAAVGGINQSLTPAVEGIKLVESFSGAEQVYSVFEAGTEDSLRQFFEASGIGIDKITAIRDINTPVRGGGKHAGDQPRPGHQTYIIQRKIPGVGSFPDEKKAKVAKGSNAAIAKFGDAIEWDHSFLTDTGTFCVYRAENEQVLREHGAMIGPEILALEVVEPIDIDGIN